MLRLMNYKLQGSIFTFEMLHPLIPRLFWLNVPKPLGQLYLRLHLIAGIHCHFKKKFKLLIGWPACTLGYISSLQNK